MKSLSLCAPTFLVAALLAFIAPAPAVVAATSASAPAAMGASAPSAMSDQALEAIVARRLKGDRTGANLAVAYIEGSHVARAFVAAGEGPDALRIGPDTAFEIGRVSGMMISALLADMIVRGEASSDDSLSDWLPEGTHLPSVEGRPIQFRDFEERSVELPPRLRRVQGNHPDSPYEKLTEKLFLDSLSELRFSESTEGQSRNSDFDSLLLSYILSLRTQSDIETLLRERLFAPLGMDGAYIANPPAGIRAAVGHRPYDGKPAKPWTFPSRFAGALGVRATLDDMVRYVQAQLAPPDNDAGRAIRYLLDSVPEPDPERVAAEAEFGEIDTLMDLGDTGGFSCFVAFSPKRQVGVVILSDTDWSTISGVWNLGRHLIKPEWGPLEGPRIPVAPPKELVDALWGEYEFPHGERILLSRRGGELSIRKTFRYLKLGYDSAGDFYPLTFDGLLRPIKNDDGSYTFIWLRNDSAIPAKRISKIR